jgi:hypothetical protein
MKKIVGILIAIVGALVFALSFSVVRTGFKIVLPSALNDNILMAIGAVILIVGVYLGFGKGGGKKMSEVPIYHGNNVVGFRRMGK